MLTPPRSAMVLAAGLGTRLHPVTETIPKPLVEINGRPLIDHALDRLASTGVERVVVNIHYKAAMMAAHLSRRDRPKIELSEEAELLDTGGGVARALPLLGEVFFVVNGDVFWLDSRDPALLRLARAFDPADMDAVLLLQPTGTAVGYEGTGDYFLDALGTPRRRRERELQRSIRVVATSFVTRRCRGRWAPPSTQRRAAASDCKWRCGARPIASVSRPRERNAKDAPGDHGPRPGASVLARLSASAGG